MKSVVKTGKTVDEAIESALKELNASLDDVKIEIMEQAKNGIFGLFGSKPAVVKVELKKSGFKEMLLSEIKKDTKNLKSKEEEVNKEFKKEAKGTPKKDQQKKLAKSEKEVHSDSQESGRDRQSRDKKASLFEMINEEIEKEEKPEKIEKTEKTELSLADSENLAENGQMSQEDRLSNDIKSQEDRADFKNSKRTNDNKNIITDDQGKESVKEFALNWLEDVVTKMHIECDFKAYFEDNDLYIEFTDISDTDAGIVIGRRAETLNALQYLLGISMNRNLNSKNRVYLDVGGYRERRTANIERLAKRNADKVLKYHKNIKLEAMNAYERRLVHTCLQNVKNIETVSEGREPYRKVVIIYKEK